MPLEQLGESLGSCTKPLMNMLYMYILVCISIYIYIYVCTHTCGKARMYTCFRVRVHACMPLCMSAFMHVRNLCIRAFVICDHESPKDGNDQDIRDLHAACLPRSADVSYFEGTCKVIGRDRP